MDTLSAVGRELREFAALLAVGGLSPETERRAHDLLDRLLPLRAELLAAKDPMADLLKGLLGDVLPSLLVDGRAEKVRLAQDAAGRLNAAGIEVTWRELARVLAPAEARAAMLAAADAIEGSAGLRPAAQPAAEVVRIKKAQLARSLGISPTELRNRLKAAEIRLAEQAEPRAKEVLVDLAQFTGPERETIRRKVNR